MATRADLTQRVLETLGVLENGQTIDNDDAELVRTRYLAKLSELAALDIIVIPDADDIEDALLDALAAVVSVSCGKAFGVSGQSLSDLLSLAAQAEQKLRRMNRARRQHMPTPSVYF